MSDIVERLRQPVSHNDAQRQRKEAADEIERLRTALRECESSLNELTPDGWSEAHHLLGIIRTALENK